MAGARLLAARRVFRQLTKSPRAATLPPLLDHQKQFVSGSRNGRRRRATRSRIYSRRVVELTPMGVFT